MIAPRKILFYTMLIGMPFVGAAFVGELYVRFNYEYETPELLKARGLQYEPSVFARHVLARREHRARGWSDWWRVNGMGYRGPEFQLTKPPGVTRIMIYGGSAVFDPVSADGLDWPRQVERILKGKGFPYVEVINAGIPGHASFDSFGRFFAEGHAFQPDYVLLYNAWNDLKTFRFNQHLLRTIGPYVESADPFLTYHGVADRLLCATSQLYYRLRRRYYLGKLSVGFQGAAPGPVTKPENYVCRIQPLPVKQYRITVEIFVALARHIGAVPVLMTQARLVAPDNTEREKDRIGYHYVQFNHQELCAAFRETDRIIQDVAREQKLSLIDASFHFTGIDSVFHDEIHFSKEGSAKVAQFVAEQLAALLGDVCTGSPRRP